MTLGIAMAVRSFVCELCGREYSRMTGDLILPTDMVCGECLEESGHPADLELWELISERRAAKDAGTERGTGGQESGSPT